jgi:hypothetical protein
MTCWQENGMNFSPIFPGDGAKKASTYPLLLDKKRSLFKKRGMMNPARMRAFP